MTRRETGIPDPQKYIEIMVEKKIAPALIFSIGESQIDKLAKGVLKQSAIQEEELTNDELRRE